MTLTLVTAPEMSGLAYDMTDFAPFLHWDEELPDAAILHRCLEAAVGHLDGPDGLLGRALINQTWDWTLDTFLAVLQVPLPPLQSVTSVKYLDAAGALQTLDPSAYAVIGAGGADKARIVPAYGTTWPATRSFPGAVTVRFVAGYGPEYLGIPAPLRHAIMMHAASLYENREAVAFLRPSEVPFGYEELVEPFRLRAFG